MKKDEEHLLTKNKMKITEMLDRRHKDRKQHLDDVQHLKLRENDVTESRDYFIASFLERFREAELNLHNMQQAANPKDMATKFGNIAEAIQELQAYVSTSTLFLPESTVNMCQRRIDDLLVQFEAIKVKLMPKKKFGFRNKQRIETEMVEVNVATSIIANNTNGTKVNKLIDTMTAVKHPRRIIDWTLQLQSDREFMLLGDEINGKDVTMSSLTNCLVQIVGHPGSVQMSNMKNCIILCGPIARSMFADNCVDCKFVFGCQQFRFHSSQSCDIYMHVTCRAIIEDCTGVRVAPYNFTYSNIDIDFIKAGLDASKNNWEDVADFNWLSADYASPNWQIMPIGDRLTDWTDVIDRYRVDVNFK